MRINLQCREGLRDSMSRNQATIGRGAMPPGRQAWRRSTWASLVIVRKWTATMTGSPASPIAGGRARKLISQNGFGEAIPVFLQDCARISVERPCERCNPLGIRQLADQEEPCAADLAWIVQAFPIKEQGPPGQLVGPELTLISPIFSQSPYRVRR